MKQDGKAKALTGIAALLVLAIFAVGILSVLLSGAGVYQRLTRRNSHAYESRTAAQYLATKVRQAESLPRMEAFGGRDALVLSQTVSEREFLTRIYCYEGWLRELFAAADGVFSPEAGEKILPMEELQIEQTGNLITFRLVMAYGEGITVTCMPRQGKGAQP